MPPSVGNGTVMRFGAATAPIRTHRQRYSVLALAVYCVNFFEYRYQPLADKIECRSEVGVVRRRGTSIQGFEETVYVNAAAVAALSYGGIYYRHRSDNDCIQGEITFQVVLRQDWVFPSV